MLVLGHNQPGLYYSQIVRLKNTVVQRVYKCCRAAALFLKIPGGKLKVSADVQVFEKTWRAGGRMFMRTRVFDLIRVFLEEYLENWIALQWPYDPRQAFYNCWIPGNIEKNVLVTVAPKLFCTVLIIPMRGMGMINTNSWQDSERLLSSEHQDK